MHMDHLKYVKLLIYACERSMKVLGQDFNTKCVVGAITGVIDAR